MKKQFKHHELQSIAVSALAVANSRKVPAATITALYAISHIVRKELDTITDELENLQEAEKAITETIRKEVFEQVKDEAKQDDAYGLRIAKNEELQAIVKRRNQLWDVKKEIEIKPVTLEVSEDFVADLPEKSYVKFMSFNAAVDPLIAYQDLIYEGFIVLKEETEKKTKVKHLK